MMSAFTIAEPLARDAYGCESRSDGETLYGVRGVSRLYVAGDVSLLDTPSVAVVGSRAGSPAGLTLASELSAGLVRAGITVVSGLALGIDAAAHRAAIANGGRTIAVMGTPLDRAYPAVHASLQEEIRREHLLVSPFAEGTRTTRRNFPARNRVMARLANATVVVEAGENSGTMHQIDECLRAERPVFIAGWLLGRADLMWPRNVLERRGVRVWRRMSDIVDAVIP